jgi:hypothetical protein
MLEWYRDKDRMNMYVIALALCLYIYVNNTSTGEKTVGECVCQDTLPPNNSDVASRVSGKLVRPTRLKHGSTGNNNG